MIKSNLHTHTTFCDGKNTPEDVVKEAIERGFDIIGFSAHAYTPTNSQWCLKKEREDAYAKEIIRLKEEYKDKIKILLGLELDYYSEVDTSQCDYTIGSVHYVYKNGNVRITLDTNILSSSEVETFLDPRISGRPVLPVGQQLLEVKYDEYLPDFIYRSLMLPNLRQTAFSKYYICRKYTR